MLAEEHPRPYGFKMLLEAVQAAAPIKTLADDLGAALKPHGDELRGTCPIHRGDNATAFAVRPDTGKWYCFRCSEGGDLLDLWRRVHGYDDAKLALMDLAAIYHVEPPKRPQSFFERDRFQKPMRDRLGRVKAGVLRRRLFRYCILPIIDATVADPSEHAEEVTRAWAEFSKIQDAAILAWYERGRADGA
jgi:hypothetical protein